MRFRALQAPRGYMASWSNASKSIPLKKTLMLVNSFVIRCGGPSRPPLRRVAVTSPVSALPLFCATYLILACELRVAAIVAAGMLSPLRRVLQCWRPLLAPPLSANCRDLL